MKSMNRIAMASAIAIFVSPSLASAQDDEDRPHSMDQIIVTAKPLARTVEELAQPTSVLHGDELIKKQSTSIAETVSQVRVNGMREFFNGLSFPVGEGYVYLLRRGADPQAFSGMGGHGVITELAALIVGGIEIAGIRFDVWIEERTQTLRGSRPEPEE